MSAPDFLGRNITMEELKKKAESYTGDWNLNEDQPDMGTALARLFIDMMGETEERFDGLSEKYQTAFYNLTGAELMPANEAKGYVTFSTVNAEVDGTLVEEGTRIQGNTEDGSAIFYETKEAVYVSPARQKAIFYVNGAEDYISPPLRLPLSVQQLEGNNQQSHVCYIGHSSLLHIQSEGEIVIDLHFPENEYHAGQQGQLINEMTWFYYSKTGFEEFASCRFEGSRVYLYKEREQPAFARKEIQGETMFWIKLEMGKVRQESRIHFPKLSLAACGNYLSPEIIYDGIVEMEAENFLPFGEHPYPYAELYIAGNEIFSRCGADIRLQFDLELLEYLGELKSVEQPKRWRTIMHRSEFKKPEPVDITIDEIVWEYYNGNGWTKIPGTGSYGGIFQNEGSRIEVHMVCPVDICPFLIAAKETYCIRLRIIKMSNLYALDGVYHTPRIRNMLLHYDYPSDLPPERVFAHNQMETKRLESRKEFSPFYNPFPGKGMLYLLFTEPLKEKDICLLFVMGQGKETAISCRFEYYGEQGWEPLRVEDRTEQLSRTELVTILASHSFQKKEIFCHSGYWIRIVQDTEEMGKIPPVKEIYLNSTIIYAEKESGKRGNLPSGITGILEKRQGFINKAVIPEAITGGCDRETKAQALKRNAAGFRHRGRAVTAKDFEDIVSSEMRNVLQVRCFPGRDGTGLEKPGQVTLAVLTEDFLERTEFHSVKRDIYRCLLPHMDHRLYDEKRLHIVEPEWKPMEIYITVVAKKSARPYQLEEKINREINNFIHPVNGNFDGKGWRIGTLPTALQIQNVCSRLDEVLYVRNISLKDEEYCGIYSLGIGGKHEIEILQE